jgi:hypothetical protein
MGSIPAEVTGFSIYLILPAALCPWSWISHQQKSLQGIFLEIKGGRRLKTDNLTAICTPIILENVEASSFHNSISIHGLLKE